MALKLDEKDKKLLNELQIDSSQPLEVLANKLGSSKTPIWNRIQKLKKMGVITREAITVDPDKVGLKACFFVLIRTNHHEESWQKDFLNAIRNRSEVIEAHRLAGEIDYIVKVRVENPRGYDVFYQSLIKQVQIYSVSALLSMEEIKPHSPLSL